ncbi:hypothetical protein [Aquimarina sp. 433]
MYLKINSLSLLSIICLLYVSFNGYTQQIELEIDYKKKGRTLETKKDIEDLDPNKEYVIKITGVNTAFMDVKINAKPKKLVSSIPEPLKLILPSISESITFGDSTEGFLGITGEDEKTDYFSKILNKVINKKNKLDWLKVETLKLYKELQNNDRDAINQQIDTILARWSSGFTSDNLKIDPDDKSNIVNQQILKEEVLSTIHYIQAANTFFNNKLAKILDPEELHESELLLYKAQMEIIANSYSAKEYLNYWQLIVKASNYSNSKTSEKYLVPEGDILEVNIAIVNTFTKDTLVKKTIDYYSKVNKWKLGFSSGFVFNNITEDKYFLQSRDANTTSIIKEDQDNVDVSIGALAHLHYKFSSATSLGLNLGIAVSPFDGETRYLFGPSILLGKKNQLAISTGAALARMNELSGAVSEDAQGLNIPAGQEIPTFKKIQWGYFIGITYNILNTKN